VFFTIFLVAQPSSQGNTLFSWRLTTTSKETNHFFAGSAKLPMKGTIFWAADENNQGNTHSPSRLTKIAKKVYFLAIRCYLEGNVIFLGG